MAAVDHPLPTITSTFRMPSSEASSQPWPCLWPTKCRPRTSFRSRYCTAPSSANKATDSADTTAAQATAAKKSAAEAEAPAASAKQKAQNAVAELFKYVRDSGSLPDLVQLPLQPRSTGSVSRGSRRPSRRFMMITKKLETSSRRPWMPLV